MVTPRPAHLHILTPVGEGHFLPIFPAPGTSPLELPFCSGKFSLPEALPNIVHTQTGRLGWWRCRAASGSATSRGRRGATGSHRSRPRTRRPRRARRSAPTATTTRSTYVIASSRHVVTTSCHVMTSCARQKLVMTSSRQTDAVKDPDWMDLNLPFSWPCVSSAGTRFSDHLLRIRFPCVRQQENHGF